MTLIRTIRRYGMNDLWYHTRLLGTTVLMKLSFRKLPNMIRCVLDWKLRRIRVRSRPPIVRIEVSAACNLRCLSCSTPKKTFGPGQIRMMTLDWFRGIYSQLAAYACRVTYYQSGEPMTNPQLFDMVKLASGRSVFTSLCTNFTLMNEKFLEPLFNSNLDWLSVCLDGFTQESYEKYRVNGHVSKVKEGIRMVMQYKKQHHFRRPFLNVYTILFKHVLPEVPVITSFCKELGVDQLTFRPDESNTYGDATDTRPQNFSLLPTSRCFWPWLTISIDVDGSVYPCPQAFVWRESQRAQGPHFSGCESKPYGNLLSSSLDEIWNNALYVETRKYLSGKGQKSSALDLPCCTCPWYGTGERHSPGEKALSLIRIKDAALNIGAGSVRDNSK
jgi:MoaA/NifB/PqqE/SkfB family radical SAM enzyme